jgi:Mrp family chromosome partitioning ATPase
MGPQFRDLLSSIERDVAATSRPIVAIVGLEERDATARVAAALGTLWSAAGRNTLLIEANAQHDLAKRYGLPHARGLCEALAARTPPREAVAPTSRELLDVLPLGRATPVNDVAWTASLLNELRGNPSHYDAIVVDVGALSSPWAIALSQGASAVYLVVSLGDASAESATASVERFRSAGGQLKGCIAVDRE